MTSSHIIASWLPINTLQQAVFTTLFGSCRFLLAMNFCVICFGAVDPSNPHRLPCCGKFVCGEELHRVLKESPTFACPHCRSSLPFMGNTCKICDQYIPELLRSYRLPVPLPWQPLTNNMSPFDPSGRQNVVNTFYQVGKKKGKEGRIDWDDLWYLVIRNDHSLFDNPTGLFWWNIEDSRDRFLAQVWYPNILHSYVFDY